MKYTVLSNAVVNEETGTVHSVWPSRQLAREAARDLNRPDLKDLQDRAKAKLAERMANVLLFKQKAITSE